MSNPFANLPAGITVAYLKRHIALEDRLGYSVPVQLGVQLTQQEAETISEAYTLLRGEPVFRWATCQFCEKEGYTLLQDDGTQPILCGSCAGTQDR